MAVSSIRDITLAHLCSATGFAFLFVATFLGLALLGGGYVFCALMALCQTVVLTMLVNLAVSARGRRQDRPQLRVFEIAGLAGYLLMASITAPRAAHFISIVFNHSELRQKGYGDVEAISEAIASYDLFERRAVFNTIRGMEDAMVNRDEMGVDVRKYFQDNQVEYQSWSIEEYKNRLNVDLFGRRYMNMTNSWRHQLQEINETVKSWSLLGLPGMLTDLKDLSDEVTDSLNMLSSSHQLPVIGRSNDNRHYVIINKNQTLEPVRNTIQQRMQLVNAMRNGHADFWGWLLTIGIHLLCLSCYLERAVSYLTRLHLKRESRRK